MKKILLLVAIIATVLFQYGYAQEAKPTPLSQLLTSYYSIKDALISSNANAAAAGAHEFVKAAGAIDMKSMSEAEDNAFMPLQEKLVADARHISENREIAHQREHFKSLSDNLYALAKAVKLSGEPVYQDYCPMKKAFG